MSDGKSPRKSERRQATVLFADISGFTSISERTDPEEITDVMNSCFAMLEEVIHEHGGHIDKYIGDCVMAMFGVPDAIEDAPQRAVNAAIEIRNRLAEFNQRQHLEAPLAVHSGVNTGLVIAGDVGGRIKRDFTVMGDAVNVASRLKDEAPSGSIYVGLETYRYTQPAFQYRQLEPITVKGKPEPITIYEVLSTREQLHRARPTAQGRMIFSDLVGRRRELDLLAQSVARVAGGQGGVVSVVGEAGIGKSRLLRELRQHPVIDEVTVLQGRCMSMGRTLSYHPFIDLLRHWAGIAEDDSEERARVKLEETISRIFPEKSSELFPFVATLMGMRLSGAHARRIEGIDGEAMERMILKTMRDLLQAGSVLRPLVVLFEDLHWADQSSVKLLESLLRMAAQAPVLFIDVFRPDEPTTSDRILSASRKSSTDRHVEVRLGPLEAKDQDVLIQNLLQVENLPRVTRELISRKAEGNPFYMEEIVRSLIDQGAIERENGKMRITAKIDTVVIPGTIQEIIMTRIDRFEEPLRQLLQTASVLGRRVNRRVLEDIVHPDADLDLHLAQLQECQLIEERRARQTSTLRVRMLAAEVEYIFKHALVQETIYESILQRTRKQLHLRVAESIEKNFRDRIPDFYGMLAYHYSRAESLDKAEEYLFSAGEAAARSAASREALDLFQEASRVYMLRRPEGGDSEKRIRLERNIAVAFWNIGDLTASIEHFDRTLELLGLYVPHQPLAANLKFGLDSLAVLYRLYAGTANDTRDLERQRQIMEVMYMKSRAETTSDPRRVFMDSVAGIRRLNRTDPRRIDQACGMYATMAAFVAYAGLSFAVSRRFLRQAKGVRREGNTGDAFTYQAMRFVTNYLAGDWEKAAEVGPDLWQAALRRGQFWDVQTYLGLDCDRRLRQGDFLEARERLRSLAEINDVYGYEFAQSNHDGMAAILLLEERRLQDAFDAVEKYYAARDEDSLQVLALGTKAKIEALHGDLEGAALSLGKVEEIIQRSRVVPPWHLCAYAVARLLHDVLALEKALARGDDRILRSLARKALRSRKYALGVADKVRTQRTEIFQLTGRLAWLLGNRPQALKWWTAAIREGRRMNAQPELGRVYADIARRIGGSDSLEVDGHGADHYRGEAERIFEAFGLSTDLADVA